MDGAFGIDPQHTRTVIALAAGAHVRSVGDGWRHLVPNACGPDGLWGSSAAERQLRTLDTPGGDLGGDGGDPDSGDDLTGHLLDWRCDPLDTPFLQGLRHRLDTYLGRTGPARHHDTVCLVGPDDAATEDRLAAAGLPGATVVAPTDALVCRWLGVPRAGGPVGGRVVAVACGETWTDVAAYDVAVDPGGAGTPVAGLVRVRAVPGARRVEAGFGALSTSLADRVLHRAGEGVTATALLTVLDGTWEYAAELAAVGPDDEVVWDKSLAGRMYDTVRLSPRAVGGWPVATSARDAVLAPVREVAGSDPLLLIGGIGATWPLAADAIQGLGEVWQSTTPAHDLAIGAAQWPQMRGFFGRPVPPPRQVPATTHPPLPEPRVPAGEYCGSLDHLPPWERDL